MCYRIVTKDRLLSQVNDQQWNNRQTKFSVVGEYIFLYETIGLFEIIPYGGGRDIHDPRHFITTLTLVTAKPEDLILSFRQVIDGIFDHGDAETMPFFAIGFLFGDAVVE